ncbi:hypothetical protein R5R35_007118 [Gryllus longicercus]|uniref:C2H2-type domain-containing protein n=1 Tax=Gryllus longicercus TaxID=2509291 RepID=A0AAN9VPZ5_9ORTH
MRRRADKARKVRGQKWSIGKQKMCPSGPPCFVCGEEIVGRGIPLLVGYTAHSKTGLPTKIGQLMGDGFMVVVNTEDMLCRRCTSLLNHLDKLEADLELVKSSLMNYLKIKYQLCDENDDDIDMLTHEGPVMCTGENIEVVDEIKTEFTDNLGTAASSASNYRSVGKEDGSDGDEWEEEGATKKVNVEIILDDSCSQRRILTSLSPETVKYHAYECEKCGYGTNDLGEIEQHPSVCMNYNHECRICGKKFDSSKTVQDHIMQTHLSKWTCHFCNTSFSEEDEFSAHMRVHIGNKSEENCNLKNSAGNYECNICDYECDNKLEYDDHIRKHVVLKLFKCKDCGKRFGEECALQEHCKSHERITKCTMCSMSFGDESGLVEHMKSHNGGLNLTNDMMEWASKENILQNADRLSLEKSGETNSEEESQKGDGIKFLSCAICSLTFLNSNLYDQHMKTHPGVELPSSSKNDIMDADNSLIISSLVNSQNYVDSVIDGNIEDMFEKMHSHAEASDNKPVTSFVPSISDNGKDVFRCEFTGSDLLKVDNDGSQGNENQCPVGDLCVSEANIKKFVSSDVFKCQETSALNPVESKTIATVNSFTVNEKERSVMTKSNDSIVKSGAGEDQYSSKNITFENIYPLSIEKKSADAGNTSDVSDGFQGINNTTAHGLDVFSSVSEEQDDANVGETVDESSEIKKAYVCAECGFRYSDIAGLKEHFKDHRNSGNKCSLCNKSFLSKLRLKRHLKAHENTIGGKMTCPTCYIEFPDYFHLFQHMQDKHQKEKVVYKCEFCNEKFTSRKAFKAHEETHPERYEFKCDQCNQTFMKEKQLKDHKDAVHRDPHCRYCGKEIMKLKTLRTHELRHLRDKDNFECDVCKRVFKTKTGLRHHVAVHTGEYKYCCDYCGRGFMSRMMMVEHRSMHTKEERYVCDVCGRKFSFQSTYWIHRKWHDNPYPYKCSFCNRMFRHSSLLAVHKRKHTGERPYQCPHCPLSFPVGGTLKRHLILHTGVYPFNCESCKRGFTTRHKYATHLAKIHGDYDLLNAKQPQGEYKMVIRDEPKQTEDLTMWKFPEEPEQSEMNFKLEVAAATAGDSIDQMDTSIPCAVVPDDMLVDSGVAARVVEIVLDDESQAVATVTLAEPNPNILPELWYQ